MPVSGPTIGICTLADSGFFKIFLYQGGVKSTVPWILEDLKFKISEDWVRTRIEVFLALPVSAKLKQQNCRFHATFILKV